MLIHWNSREWFDPHSKALSKSGAIVEYSVGYAEDTHRWIKAKTRLRKTCPSQPSTQSIVRHAHEHKNENRKSKRALKVVPCGQLMACLLQLSQIWSSGRKNVPCQTFWWCQAGSKKQLHISKSSRRSRLHTCIQTAFLLSMNNRIEVYLIRWVRQGRMYDNSKSHMTLLVQVTCHLL